MARRTGVPTLLYIAERMCDLLSRYSGVIYRLHPENTALQAALAAAQVACAALHLELDLVRERGD